MKNTMLVLVIAVVAVFSSCKKTYVTEYTTQAATVIYRDSLNGDKITFAKPMDIIYSQRDAMLLNITLDSAGAIPGTVVTLYSYPQEGSIANFNTGIISGSLYASNPSQWAMTITYIGGNFFNITLSNP